MAAGFFNQLLTQLGTGDQIKDWQHASRTFVDGLYRLSPKMGSMFHVYIDVNSQLVPGDPTEIGMMAKTVTLPKFTIQNKILNAYNRKNIIQERINYDPINLTFHDDSSDIVNKFWQGYYQYYYRDWDHQEALYKQESKYQKRQAQDWGFSPKSSGTNAPNYINSIRIYSLHQKSFSSYILINPMITSFQHGQHAQGEYTPLENSMTVAYEAVHYESGPVRSGKVMGFDHIHYDKTASPLSSLGGGTQSLLGQGGAVEGIGDVLTNLGSGNFGAAALGALRTGNNLKNMDIKQVANAELKQTAMNILRGQNTQSTVFVPTASSVQAGLSKAVSSIPGLVGVRKSSTGNMN
jgi:hypothetical protein